MEIRAFNTVITPFQMEVTFRVMVPDGYENGERNYPVLYMNDGQDLFYDEDAINGRSMRYAKYYSQYSRFLPQVIIVGIDCPMNNAMRTRQYTPYTKCFDVPEGKNFEREIHGTGKEYVNWIAEELKPWIDRNYRTMPQARYTALGGYSTGGLLSVYGVVTRPAVFSRLLVMSGAFYIWMDCLEDTLEQYDLNHLRYIYLDAGSEDQGRMTTREQFAEGGQMLYEHFLSYGFNEDQLKFEVFEGMHHDPREFGLRFPDALRWIFKDI